MRSTTTRVLAFAYACEPNKGSEPGAGWNWVRMIARFADVWVITRANNRESIESFLDGLPERDRLHFVYVDLPAWARFWKRGQRGVRLYYLLWMALARRVAREMHLQEPFDIVWHLTIANVWLGSLAPFPGPRFIFGPVGGGISTSWGLLPLAGFRGAAYEVARSMLRSICRWTNPLVRYSLRRADLVLVQNQETHDFLPRKEKPKAVVFPNPVLDLHVGKDPARQVAESGFRTAIVVGRLQPLKGVALAIEAVARLDEVQLLICGSGRDENRLRNLVLRRKVEDRVRFLSWIPHEEVLRLMREEADVFLSPSLHEEGGFAVVEALAQGLPVVCLDRGGPPALAGSAAVIVKAGNNQGAVVDGIVDAIRVAIQPGSTQSAAASEVGSRFVLDERARELESLVSPFLANKIRS